MARRLIGRTVAVLVVLVLLGLFVPPFINVGRYRARVAESLSNAVGHPVTVGSIELRMVPQPGFDLENVVIADDPAFSAEPILRADEVTAYLRLSSLWRGRLEVAKLRLNYPSLNIVRGTNGHFNIESMLWRATRTQAAPTTQRRPEGRTRFPYIEANNGRINFKSGLAKSEFAFNDADFALWSPAENEWTMRIEAKPMRSDVPLSDMGVFKAEASLKRAEMLRDTPVRGKFAWDRPQLGQLTKFIYGRDRGWRGGVQVAGEFSGTPADLHFSTSASVHDFRRYDIIEGEPIRLSVACKGMGNVPASAISGFSCQMPTGEGSVVATGEIGKQFETYDVSLAVENVPANFFVALARHAKRNLPTDLSARGTVNTSVHLRQTGPEASSRIWTGSGATNDLMLQSGVLSQPLQVGKVEFTISAPAEPVPAKSGRVQHRGKAPAQKTTSGEFLRIASFPLELGKNSKMTVAGSITTDGYMVSASGPATVQKVIELSRALGVSAPRVNLAGALVLDAAVNGKWQGLPEPAVSGTGKLTDGRAEVPGIAKPIEIASADVSFANQAVRLTNISANVGQLKFGGATGFQRHCDDDEPCGPEFSLAFDTLDLNELNALVNPRLKQRPWYRLFGSRKEESVLSTLSAVGKITAKRVTLDKLNASRVHTDFRLQKGNLVLMNTRGELYGGTHTGDWTADFNGRQPVYKGTGRLEHVNVGQLATLLNPQLGTGVLNATYQAELSGYTEEEIQKSASVIAEFNWNKGVAKTVVLNGHSPLQVMHFSGKANWKGGALQFEDARLQSGPNSYTVSGKANSTALELQLATDHGSGYRISGSLQKPAVESLESQSRNQASLKR